MPMGRIGRDAIPGALLRRNPMGPHQPGDPMPPTGYPLSVQFLPHPWTAIGLIAGLMDRPDVDQQLSVLLGARTLRPPPPRVVATAPYRQDPTHQPDRIEGAMAFNEAIPHRPSLAKKAIAFFKISCSNFRRAFSRRSRRSSSRSVRSCAAEGAP